MSDQTPDDAALPLPWPHDPTEIVREALRDYVGDGEGVDVTVLAAHDAWIRADERARIAARRDEVAEVISGPRFVEHGPGVGEHINLTLEAGAAIADAVLAALGVSE